MRNLKLVFLASSLIATASYAEVNLLLLSHTLEERRLIEAKKACKTQDCHVSIQEALDEKRDILNKYENPKTHTDYDVWSTKSYAQRNEKKFNENLEALKRVDSYCDKRFALVQSVGSGPYINEKLDAKFCLKMKEHLEKSLIVHREAFPNKQDKAKEEALATKAKKGDELAGCTLSFDQSEINCPNGVYIRSKSIITDAARNMKSLESNDGKKLMNDDRKSHKK